MKKHTEGFHFSILKAPKQLMIVPKVSMKQETAPKTLYCIITSKKLGIT
eukprot:UN22796